MVVILLTETIIAHTKLEVIMGFIDGFIDLCESASRRIAKEREVSEFNKATGMTTEERLSCCDNLQLFEISISPGQAYRERIAAKSILNKRGFDSYIYDLTLKSFESDAPYLTGTYTYSEFWEKRHKGRYNR